MKAKGELTAAINSQEKVDPYHLDSLLIGETLVDSAGDKEWGQLYFIDESQKKVFLIETRQDMAVTFDPITNRDQLLYYALDKIENQEEIVLRSLSFANNHDEIIAAPGRDYEVRGGWLSPDGKDLIYQRVLRESGEAALWGHNLQNNLVEELMTPEAGLYPAPAQQWGADSERFYFTKNVGNDSYVLYESRGSVISPAFPIFRWDQVDWVDIWETKPLAVSPDGLTAVYLDRQEKNGVVASTDVNIIDQSGGKTNLLTAPGDIYEIIWSPSGQKLAFNVATHNSTGRREKAELWTVESDGDNPLIVHKAEETGAMLYDLHWGRNDRIYFAERSPQLYSLVQVIDLRNKKLNVIERYVAGEDGDGYLRLLQNLDMPKKLDWQEK